MKKLGVIILNWNGLGLLKRFVPAAFRYTQSDSADLIVADNGSTDGSVEWLRANYPEVKILAFAENLGFAGGYDKAIGSVDYEYVTLLNSDVEVTEGWWQPILRFLEENPDVGAVQPKILSLRDRSEFEYAGAAGGALDNLGYAYCRGRLFNVVEKDEGQYDGAPVDVAWASGACLTLPRDVYFRAGGLDPKFFAHMEEIDLCCRIHGLGLRVCALTDSKVYHLGGASLNQGNPMKTYLNFRNNLLLIHKNMTEKAGRRMLIKRRLADIIAFMMFLAKFDFPSAWAILKAHSDFRKMRKEYTDYPSHDILPGLPGAKYSAIIARYIKRRRSLPIE